MIQIGNQPLTPFGVYNTGYMSLQLQTEMPPFFLLLTFFYAIILPSSPAFQIPSQTAFVYTSRRTPYEGHHFDKRRKHDIAVWSVFDDDQQQGVAEENYQRKLNEAKEAIQRAESARFKLSPSSPLTTTKTTTVARRSKVSYTDAGTLCLELKASGLDSSSIFGGAFSLAWFSAIVPATFASMGSALFLLPFWAAGGMVAKSTLVDPLTGVSLSIGEFAWSMQKTLGRKRFKEMSGATADILEAVVEVAFTQEGSPTQYHLKLIGPDCVFGTGLSESELTRLADQINEHLAKVRVQTSN